MDEAFHYEPALFIAKVELGPLRSRLDQSSALLTYAADMRPRSVRNVKLLDEFELLCRQQFGFA
jgi:hypothetical protein